MVANGSGDGSIRHRADGRFEIRVRDAATGIRVARYATTEREARKMLRAMLGRVDRGVVAADASATVRGYAEVWLAERAGRRRTESTVREYRRRLNKYVLPRIGGLKLSALTMLDVEDALDELVESGLSASTVRGSRIALAAMLTDAVRARHLAVNEAALARLPEMDRSARAEVPTSVQVLDLLDAAIWFDEMAELLTVLATTGVRVGEALGAYWSDLDLEAGVWEVQRTTTVNAAGVAVIGSRTKTGEGRRVALHDAAVAAFTAPAGAGGRCPPRGRPTVERPRPRLPLRARHRVGLAQRTQAAAPHHGRRTVPRFLPRAAPRLRHDRCCRAPVRCGGREGDGSSTQGHNGGPLRTPARRGLPQRHRRGRG